MGEGNEFQPLILNRAGPERPTRRPRDAKGRTPIEWGRVGVRPSGREPEVGLERGNVGTVRTNTTGGRRGTERL